MRNVHIFFFILAYCRSRFVSAQVNANQVGETSDLDDYDDRDYAANRTGQAMSTSADIALSNRFLHDQETERASRRMLDEFQSDLAQIQKFAQQVHPIATNVRRSMQSRRSSDFKMYIFKRFLLNILNSLIATVEQYVPVLRPATKYIRKFVTMMLG